MTERKRILVCGGTGCLSSKSGEIINNLNNLITQNNITEKVEVIQTGCFGFCEKGPVLKILPSNTLYVEVKPEDADKIINSDILNNVKIDELLYVDPISGEKIDQESNMNFYKKQLRIALKNCGAIDPESIEHYFLNEGYAGLKKSLSITPQEVITIIKESGLRGRGGGGFSTGVKWEYASKNISDIKYVICNADEGDPGAFMDRSILEGDPHSIIEGMSIAAYAVGASKGFVYIRAEYPLAIKRLKKAINDARKNHILGNNIFNTSFSFDIEIKYGAGAFVCGEETALIKSMEGERGESTSKPPYPIKSGYLGKPTVVNNVETFANISQIILNGSSWFRQIGTENSPGTKVFALAGKINNVGLVEVPMGTTLREVIYEIGGGIKNNKKFKAVQTGGPSGGCLTEKDLDTPIDFDTLLEKGSMMGSGGMIVMDEDDCMISVAKFYLEFTVDESCGKCSPCRIGNVRLYELLDKISMGKGTAEDLEKLKTLSETIKSTSLCGLGQTSPNPILSTLSQFYDEYKEHIFEKKCRAKQCKDLKTFIISNKCVGCGACVNVCVASCIVPGTETRYTVIQDDCVKCGNCYKICKFKAINIE